MLQLATAIAQELETLEPTDQPDDPRSVFFEVRAALCGALVLARHAASTDDLEVHQQMLCVMTTLQRSAADRLGIPNDDEDVPQ
jgi:hypothetical protein